MKPDSGDIETQQQVSLTKDEAESMFQSIVMNARGALQHEKRTVELVRDFNKRLGWRVLGSRSEKAFWNKQTKIGVHQTKRLLHASKTGHLLRRLGVIDITDGAAHALPDPDKYGKEHTEKVAATALGLAGTDKITKRVMDQAIKLAKKTDYKPKRPLPPDLQEQVGQINMSIRQLEIILKRIGKMNDSQVKNDYLEKEWQHIQLDLKNLANSLAYCRPNCLCRMCGGADIACPMCKGQGWWNDEMTAEQDEKSGT